MGADAMTRHPVRDAIIIMICTTGSVLCGACAIAVRHACWLLAVLLSMLAAMLALWAIDAHRRHL